MDLFAQLHRTPSLCRVIKREISNFERPTLDKIFPSFATFQASFQHGEGTLIRSIAFVESKLLLLRRLSSRLSLLLLCSSSTAPLQPLGKAPDAWFIARILLGLEFYEIQPLERREILEANPTRMHCFEPICNILARLILIHMDLLGLGASTIR